MTNKAAGAVLCTLVLALLCLSHLRSQTQSDAKVALSHVVNTPLGTRDTSGVYPSTALLTADIDPTVRRRRSRGGRKRRGKKRRTRKRRSRKRYPSKATTEAPPSQREKVRTEVQEPSTLWKKDFEEAPRPSPK